jgi:hypothetical protein
MPKQLEIAEDVIKNKLKITKGLKLGVKVF